MHSKLDILLEKTIFTHLTFAQRLVVRICVTAVTGVGVLRFANWLVNKPNPVAFYGTIIFLMALMASVAWLMVLVRLHSANSTLNERADEVINRQKRLSQSIGAMFIEPVTLTDHDGSTMCLRVVKGGGFVVNVSILDFRIESGDVRELEQLRTVNINDDVSYDLLSGPLDIEEMRQLTLMLERHLDTPAIA